MIDESYSPKWLERKYKVIFPQLQYIYERIRPETRESTIKILST